MPSLASIIRGWEVHGSSMDMDLGVQNIYFFEINTYKLGLSWAQLSTKLANLANRMFDCVVIFLPGCLSVRLFDCEVVFLQDSITLFCLPVRFSWLTVRLSSFQNLSSSKVLFL